LIHNIQRDPVALAPIHIDFLKIDLKKKVTANIPVVLIGESPAEKQGLGTLVSYVDEVEVEALPGDLVDKFELSVDSLVDVDQSLAIKDLLYDKDKIAIKDDLETIIVKVELQKEEVVEEVKPAEEAVPAEGEGEKPAEGEPESGTEEAPKEEKKEEK
jgi:large subunit ribosomal protein L25